MSLLAKLPKTTEKKSKRLGRGLSAGKGAKSGRGTTRHQKARGKIPLFFEGGQGRLVKRFPLIRGKGKNKAARKKPYVVTLSMLNVFNEGEVITLDSLVAKKIVGNDAYLRGAKVVNKGKLEKKLDIKLPMSETVVSLLNK